ncbi:DUF2939 domain-containing protein [Microbulbifer epialgicus]|uniref:DUF2939 domain-containing protein n=1 Tax=Microbulbifer epialgicus TaxID=393907 RepID=A0ABV4NUI2_9GAMM
MKKVLWTGAVVLALLLAGYVALPFHALEQLQRAAKMATAEEQEKRRESIDTLERYVDFPVLRDNLRIRLQEQLRSSLGNSLPQEFDELMTAGANFLMGPLLQQFVTLEGVAELLRGGEELQAFERELFSRGMSQEQPLEPEKNGTAEEESPDGWKRLSWRFTDINHLRVDYGENGRAELRLLLQRNGLHWQLVDIQLLDNTDREG